MFEKRFGVFAVFVILILVMSFSVSAVTPFNADDANCERDLSTCQEGVGYCPDWSLCSSHPGGSCGIGPDGEEIQCLGYIPKCDCPAGCSWVLEEQGCRSGTVCGNGEINAGEECDFELQKFNPDGSAIGCDINYPVCGPDCKCTNAGDPPCQCEDPKIHCKSGEYCNRIGVTCNPVGYINGMCATCKNIGTYDKDCVKCAHDNGEALVDSDKNGARCDKNGKEGRCQEGHCVPLCQNPPKLVGEWACVTKEGDNMDKGFCTKEKAPVWDTGIGCRKQVEGYLKELSRTAGYLNGKVSSEQIKNFNDNFYFGCVQKGQTANCYVGRLGAVYGKWEYVTIDDSDVEGGYRIGSRSSHNSIYLARQFDCYTPNGYAYEFNSNLREFNKDVLKIFFSDKNCDEEITIDKVGVSVYENSELQTDEVLSSCNFQYTSEESLIISPLGGTYEALCDSGVCHVILKVPIGAVSQGTALTIREINLSECSCGDGICSIDENSNTCLADCRLCEIDEDCGISCSNSQEMYRTGTCISRTCRNMVYNDICSPASNLILYSETNLQDILTSLSKYNQKQLSLEGLQKEVSSWISGFQLVLDY